MRSQVASKAAVVLVALAGTAAAFLVGAQAGAMLNGRVMAISVARVSLPVMSSPKASPGHLARSPIREGMTLGHGSYVLTTSASRSRFRLRTAFGR